jgi:hypothetical protein
MTSERASTKAGRTLALSDDPDAKSAAASALAQTDAPRASTSADVAGAAGRTLASADASPRAKSAAGSALAQYDPEDTSS